MRIPVVLISLVILSYVSFTYAESSPNAPHPPWNYDTIGVDAWPIHFSNCRGRKQSPIDIKTNEVEYDKNLKPFSFISYGPAHSWNVSHNGHTVVANRLQTSAVQVGVEGSDLEETFDLLQFHFHWGYNNYHGSEHTVNGDKYPLELHLVHKSKSGRFAVLGFFFKISETDNAGLDGLLNSINTARTEGESVKATFSLNSILPNVSALNSYYRYSGSLTTPPCTEGIIWNVFRQTIGISSEQMMNFRNNKVKINFREPQRMNGRKVFSSFPTGKSNKHDLPAANSEGGHHDSKTACNAAVRLPIFNMASVATLMASSVFVAAKLF